MLRSCLSYYRSFSSYSKRIVIQDTGFERKWKSLSDSEKEKINEEYDTLREQDWRQLTLDQKRDCISFFIIFSIYNFLWTTSRS